MANVNTWNPLRSGRAAVVCGAGLAAATIGGVLWKRRSKRERWTFGGDAESDRPAEVLSTLIATCVDGERGFQTAAEGIKDLGIRALFEQYARQRRDFRLELERATRRFGAISETSGSVAGTLHHAWMNIKSIVTRGDEGAIIAEAERGEDTAVRAYQDALRASLPAELRDLVQRQFTAVKAAHDRVRELERTHTQA
jgi:uncharacterized protein (TIGR02284 family)